MCLQKKIEEIDMVKMFYWLHNKIEDIIGSAFDKHGRFIARHPWMVIVAVVCIDIGLGIGVLQLKQESGIEQYTPIDSKASLDRAKVQNMFNVNDSYNFYLQSLTDFGRFGTVIIEAKDGRNILNSSLWNELQSIYSHIITTDAKDGYGKLFTYKDVCSKRFTMCVVEGDFIFSPRFITDLENKQISFPEYFLYGNIIYINAVLGGVELDGKYLKTAKAIKLRFNLVSDQPDKTHLWETAFLNKVAAIKSDSLSIKYSYSDSLTTELNKTIFGDLSLIAVTFLSIIVFSSAVLVEGNCILNRSLLGVAGIVSTVLAIIAAVGFLGFCGVKFVDIVGGMPFLVLGIGVDDMFVLLSGLAYQSSSDTIETRIGKTMKQSGISITITSLTDVVAFCVGTTSIFPSVKYFSFYTGCALLFCYLNYITFFCACMTVNEIRVSKNMHFCTCKKTQSSVQMEKDGKSRCCIAFCSGEPKVQRGLIEGPLERVSKNLLKKTVLKPTTQIFIGVLFVIYIGFSIWGVSRFKEGLNFRDLLRHDSYYYDFYDTDQTYFDQSIIVSINFGPGIDYHLNNSIQKIDSLVEIVRSDPEVEDNFLLSWIHAYMRSEHYNTTSNVYFINGLNNFLSTAEGSMYVNDVSFSLDSISASRIHVISKSLTTSNQQAQFMLRIRESLNFPDIPVFAYSPAFILLENYAHVYSQTLQTITVCVGIIFCVTFIFIPLPMILLLVTLNVVFIMLGVVGFMYFWGLTLSSITMIYIIMCVGFCIDFSTHICHAYVQAQNGDRKTRTASSIDMAGGAVFNGAVSTIVGVSMLSLSSSQIFISFFKVMFLVMTFGLAHALLLLPVMLSCVGPKYKEAPSKEIIIEQQQSVIWEEVNTTKNKSEKLMTDEEEEYYECRV